MSSELAPTFVVGPSRSGTSLVRHILNRHSNVWLTGETHYFDDLRPRMKNRERAPLSRADLEECERYFLAIARAPYRVAGASVRNPIRKEELRDRAAAVGIGADSYFEAFCRLNAEARSKERWGEKTPRHVFRIDEILARYPTAKIIALVRDPRAVVVSYRDLHTKPLSREREELLAEDRKRARRSYHVLLATLLWRSAMRATLNAFERHGADRIRLLRFEDLVRAPERSVQELTAWIGVPYEEAMLEVNLVSSSHRLDKEETGISPESADRWRSRLRPSEAGVIETGAGSLLAQLGYARESHRGSQLHHVALACLTLPYGFLRAFIANRDRIGSLSAYVAKRARLVATR